MKRMVLKSGYLEIVGEGERPVVTVENGFIYYDADLGNKEANPDGDAHLTVRNLTLSSVSGNEFGSINMVKINDSKYACQSTFDNVTFTGWMEQINSVVDINNNAVHTFQNCTFVESNIVTYSEATCGINVQCGDVSMKECSFDRCVTHGELYGHGHEGVHHLQGRSIRCGSACSHQPCLYP